ncbi:MULTISPECIES: hypothetical protein [Nocardioides]|uniref:Uncharacterized protein n=1 Tax=Nocardioides vastitatis TaxID=2568655 RepID=A0ABW0ZAB4_9ACTN|nr:hypothetical protein [Nocardioides sp.]
MSRIQRALRSVLGTGPRTSLRPVAAAPWTHPGRDRAMRYDGRLPTASGGSGTTSVSP